jgi:hypothetical protein
VADTTGRITVEVPSQWGRQLRASGWAPKSLGLPDAHAPGLAVADDLATWQNLRSEANGVFVGLSEHGDLTGEVRALTHTGCHYQGARTYAGEAWRGQVRSWSGCPGSGGSVTEAGLAPADGGKQPQVYVQIRQDGGDATDRILDSLTIKG